ncbi:hypothetical protein CBM2633_B90089 [Cupriavidus taiwanensis]|nr:hypothetical protein CBM2633_B90089 [Cupriavidus taiwanensis]
MNFQANRRQKFLSEENYRLALDEIPLAIEQFKSGSAGSGVSAAEGWLISYRMIAFDLFNLLVLKYTGGKLSKPCTATLKVSWKPMRPRPNSFANTGETPTLSAFQSIRSMDIVLAWA